MCGNNEGERNDKTCVCCPYRSPLLMTSQVLSTIAFIISWVWWATFLVGLPTMVVLQVVWCCRMEKAGIVAAGVMSTITALLSVFAGVWMIVKWKGNCHSWSLTDDDTIYYGYTYNSGGTYLYYDDCNETAWSAVAFVQAGLWGTTAILVWYVLCSGKFDQMRRKADEEEIALPESSATIEMGGMSSVPVAPVATAVMVPTEEANKYNADAKI